MNRPTRSYAASRTQSGFDEVHPHVRSAHFPTDQTPTGSVVALRSIMRGLQTWDFAPRRIAVVALDSGSWCFAWITGGHSTVGARVRYLSRLAGESYPTFVLADGSN